MDEVDYLNGTNLPHAYLKVSLDSALIFDIGISISSVQNT